MVWVGLVVGVCLWGLLCFDCKFGTLVLCFGFCLGLVRLVVILLRWFCCLLVLGWFGCLLESGVGCVICGF